MFLLRDNLSKNKMKIKKLQIVNILVLCFLVISCKTVKSDNLLEAPETWRKEVLEFPLIFARSLPYKGEEHIRFAEGWGDVESQEYFSYAFIWLLEEDPQLNAQIIESDMDEYFTGLMKMGLLTKFKLFKKLPKTITSFNKVKNTDNLFLGTIEVYDAFFKNEKIELNVRVSVRYCTSVKKYVVYFRLSPKGFLFPVWDELDKVDVNFDCDTSFDGRY